MHPTTGGSYWTNQVITRHQFNATYASDWATESDGTFPGNVLLPILDYDLEIARAGYANAFVPGVIASPTAGTTVELGTYYLQPADTNANGIGDAWEIASYGTGVVVEAQADSDE